MEARQHGKAFGTRWVASSWGAGRWDETFDSRQHQRMSSSGASPGLVLRKQRLNPCRAKNCMCKHHLRTNPSKTALSPEIVLEQRLRLLDVAFEA